MFNVNFIVKQQLLHIAPLGINLEGFAPLVLYHRHKNGFSATAMSKAFGVAFPKYKEIEAGRVDKVRILDVLTFAKMAGYRLACYRTNVVGAGTVNISTNPASPMLVAQVAFSQIPFEFHDCGEDGDGLLKLIARWVESGELSHSKIEREFNISRYRWSVFTDGKPAILREYYNKMNTILNSRGWSLVYYKID